MLQNEVTIDNSPVHSSRIPDNRQISNQRDSQPMAVSILLNSILLACSLESYI